LFHDYYYKDISHKTFEERSQTNFDHPDSLDTDLLLQHLKELKAGAACEIPTYDFTTHSRNASSKGMEPKKIIIVEGILLFTHPELTDEMDVKVFVVGLPTHGVWRNRTPRMIVVSHSHSTITLTLFCRHAPGRGFGYSVDAPNSP
jgi:uridine kinase